MGKRVNKPKRNIVSTRIDDDLMQRLDAAEKTTGLSRSDLLLVGLEVAMEDLAPTEGVA